MLLAPLSFSSTMAQPWGLYVVECVFGLFYVLWGGSVNFRTSGTLQSIRGIASSQSAGELEVRFN